MPLLLALVAAAALSFFLPLDASAYPNAEVAGSGGINPPFDMGVNDTVTGFMLFTDERIAVSYGETLRLFNVGRYEADALQPPVLTVDAGTDGRIAAIAYDSTRDRIVASQEDGDLVIYDLSDITAEPETFTVVENAELGPIAIDGARNVVYVADNTNSSIRVVNMTSMTLTSTLPLPKAGSVCNDALFNDLTDEAWFSTNAGAVVYVSASSGTATAIYVDPTLDPGRTFNLAALSSFSLGRFIYVLNAHATSPSVYRIRTSDKEVMTSAELPVPITDNAAPTDIEVADVVNPSGTYAYVGGSGGVTIIDTGSDLPIKQTNPNPDKYPLPTSATPYYLAASSASDGNVYMNFSTGELGILSTNPFIDITSVVFSDGGQVLKKNGSFTLTFQSDQAGTATVRAGGGVAADGALLTDDQGAVSWGVAASTPVALTFEEATNSAAFVEGDNDVWVFLAAGGTLNGRRSTLVEVDTPPPNVVLRSAGFGDTRLYITFDRLDVSDMASYNIYLDTDPNAVLTKGDASASPAQTSSGSTMTVEVGGLINGTTYYIAMEGVDAGGNTSPARTNTFADGAVASGMPESTVGPAGLLGEGGCSLQTMRRGGMCAEGVIFALALLVSLCVPLALKYRPAGRLLVALALTAALFSPSSAFAQVAEEAVQERDVPAAGIGRESPQIGFFEIGMGFWMPRNDVLDAFFTKCCNIIPKIQGGVLFNKRYGIELGVGFLYKTAAAIGSQSGQPSQDRFNFLLIPIETNFAWRADYFSWRYLVPYMKAGVDYVFFREGDKGKTVSGMKYGIHGEGGLQINVGEMGGMNDIMDGDYGINDFFITLGARYQWINNFGKAGLDLSGPVYSMSLLFEF